MSATNLSGTRGDELIRRVARAYAELLRRQRTASSVLIHWQRETSRTHEFVWVGGVIEEETLLRSAKPLLVDRHSALFESVQKMYATSELNPYEREVLYGYPYVIGRSNGRAIRAPLLTMPVRIESKGSGFSVEADDEILRLNTLPFTLENDVPARQHGLRRLLEATPAYPLSSSASKDLLDNLRREVPELRVVARLDGQLVEPPVLPNEGTYLQLVDQAALFVAPKSSYFLTSDLEAMADGHDLEPDETALDILLTGPGDERTAEFEPGAEDHERIYYPFPSNRSQRKAALLVDDPGTRVVRIEGPPGTGKSQTIANLACHLAATGRTVLITSHRDQALHVVDEKLRELGLPQLPMTLLRHDKASRKELRERFESIQKRRLADEATRLADAAEEEFSRTKSDYRDLAQAFEDAVETEKQYMVAAYRRDASVGLRGVFQAWRFRGVSRQAKRRSPRTTSELAMGASGLRSVIMDRALEVLELRQDASVSKAQRSVRQQIREFAALLKRDQSSYRNFSIFDRLKGEPERARMLTSLLPVWIMAPDDVARLFPCEPGLFDVVIVDEASQVDLPAIAPVLFRAKKAVISGDTRQMQPQRFRFTHFMLATEAWIRQGLDSIDPDGWLKPTKNSLLTLAAIRAEEENLLDEHYRSLPPIIQFSNHRWYQGKLRVMTDEGRKRYGGPSQSIIELHYTPEGHISNGSHGQENAIEADALVAKLQEMMEHPAYAEASFGVVCLFEQQVDLVQDLVRKRIRPELWEEHDLVVVNPDGFQGDERDVILYSLSFDNQVMSRSAIAARMQDWEHIQGMLNVAFTRARDEIHVFHSAPVEEFAFAGGRASAIGDWLIHCRAVQARGRSAGNERAARRADSVFEVEVADALVAKGYTVTEQYPSCGFRIDIVVEHDGRRLALECDGERYHLDEHGALRWEDLERQAILERAGWDVVRIPYRTWRQQPEDALAPVVDFLERDDESTSSETETSEYLEDVVTSEVAGPPSEQPRIYVSGEEKAVLEALLENHKEEEDVLRRGRDLLGYSRLGNKIRGQLQGAIRSLEQKGLIGHEDGEFYLTSVAKEAEFHVRTSIQRRGSRSRRSLYSAHCSNCGASARVPFKPTAGWPVYCRRCYVNKRR